MAVARPGYDGSAGTMRQRLAAWATPARLWIVAAFVVSRAVYFAAGVRFNARPLWEYFQFVEPHLLRDRLLESLFYLHMQPPGFNLLAGLVLKAFPETPGPALHAVYLAAGLATALCTYELMRRMGVTDRIAVPLVIVFTASPGIVLFENLLMYEYLSLAQLSAAALLLHRFVERRTLARALAFQMAMLSLMLVRNSFHLPYYLLLTAAMCWWMKDGRRAVMLSAALPLAVMTGLHVKNWMLFGQFTTSTWLGLNAGTVTTHQLSEEERESLNRAGVLSKVGMIEPAYNLRYYKPYITMPPPTGIAVLDIEENARDRANFNHPAYFQVHRYYIEDAKRILRHYPQAYVRSVMKAWFCYFLPLGDYPFFGENRLRILAWDQWFNRIVFGQWKQAGTRKDLQRVQSREGSLVLTLYTGVYLMAAFPVLFAYGLRTLWRGWRNGARDAPRAAVMAFVLYNIASLTVLSNFLSSFENNRYRLPLDGFYLVLAGMALAAVARRVAAANFTSYRPFTAPLQISGPNT